MYQMKLATCAATSCQNNANRATVMCCSACGKCGEDSFHDDCTATSGMRDAVLGVCGEDDCANAASGLSVLVCSVCGQCGDCSFHGH